MADLPRNEQYQTGGGTNVPDVSGLSNLQSIGRLGTRAKLAGQDVSKRPTTQALPNLQNLAQQRPAIEEGAPVSEAPEERYTPLPEGYESYPGFRAERTPQGFVWPKPDPETTKLRNLTNIGLPGQYVIDKAKPGRIIKSARGITSAERNAVLGGRPSHLYEVDHVIPLWAGGADTNANLQVLSRPEHDKKTKAQAVAYTLLANGEINEQLARQYALTWGERDLSDIPRPRNGVIPLEAARKIKEKWDLQQNAKPEVSFTDFLKSIPEGTERAFDFTEMAEGKGAVLETLAGASEGLIKGTISGVTAGWVPYQPQDDAGWVEKGAGIVGNIAGMLLPVGAVAKGLRVAGAGLKAARGGNWLARSASKASQTSNAAKTLGIGKGANALGARTSVTAPSWARRQLSKVAYGNLASNTAALTLYGQATPQAVEDRMGRFYEDLAFGVLAPIGGRAAGARFMGKSTAAQMSAEAFGAGASASTISLMADPEHPVDALINGGVMAALHSATVPQYRRHVKNLDKALKDEKTRMANNVLHTYTPERRPLLKETDPVDGVKISQDEVVTLRGEAMKKLDAVNAEGRLSPEAYYAERKSILAATSALEETGLRGEALKRKHWNDLVSLAEQTKRLNGRNPTEPPRAQEAVSLIEQEGLLSNSYANVTAPPTGKYPVGKTRLSGMATEHNPYPEKVTEFYQRLSEGKASPTVLIFDRPEFSPVWRSVNNGMTQGQVKANTHTPIKNPQNAGQVFGVMWDDAGRKELVQLGWEPRRFHIEDVNEGGGALSFNTRARENAERLKKSFGPEDPYWVDPNMNKDTLSVTRKKNGLDFNIATIDQSASGVSSLTSGEPYMNLILNDEHWAKSIDLNNKLRAVSSGKETRSVPQMIKEVNSSLNAKKKQADLKDIRDRVEEPADAILKRQEAAPVIAKNPEGYAATESFLANAREALSENTPEGMATKMKQLFGIDLNDKKMRELFDRRNSVTVREMGKLLKDDGDPNINALLRETIGPYIGSRYFRTQWEYGPVFPDLRIMGGIKPQEARVAPQRATEAPTRLEGQVTAERASEGQITPESGRPQRVSQKPRAAVEPTRQTEQPRAAATAVETTAPQARASTRGVTAEAAPAAETGGVQARPRGARQEALPLEERISSANKETGVPQPRESTKPTQQKIRARVMSDIMDDMFIQGQEALDNIEVNPQRPGQSRSAYIQNLRRTINDIQPNDKARIPTDSTGKTRPINDQERRQINEAVKGRLLNRAEQMVEDAYSTANEIDFKVSGVTPGTPEYQAMRAVVDADTAMKLGRRGENIRRITDNFEEAELEEAAKRLGLSGGEGGGQTFSQRLRTAVSREEGPRRQGLEPLSEAEKSKEFKALRATREKAAKERVSSIKQGMKQDDDPYYKAWAKTLDELYKRVYGEDYDSPRVRSLIGSVWASGGFRGSQPRQFRGMFDTRRTGEGLRERTSTTDYLEKIGEGDIKGLQQAKQRRQTQLDEGQRGEGSLIERGGEETLEGQAITPEDLSARGMHIESPTQDIGQSLPLTQADMQLTPGLTAAIETGRTPNALNGAVDAKAQVLFEIKTLNQRFRENAERYGSKPRTFFLDLLGEYPSRGTDAEKAAYRQRNDRAIDRLLADIVDDVDESAQKQNPADTGSTE